MSTVDHIGQGAERTLNHANRYGLGVTEQSLAIPQPETTENRRPDRRRFLRIAGSLTATGLAAACDSSTSGKPTATKSKTPATTPPTTTATPSPTPKPTPKPTPTPTHARPADYTALGRGMHGQLIQPGESSYDAAK